MCIVQPTVTMKQASRLFNIIRRSMARIQCKFCWTELNIKDYNRHLWQKHRDQHLNNRCIYCMEYTWKKRDQTCYKHQITCIKNRIYESNCKIFGAPLPSSRFCTNCYSNRKILQKQNDDITSFLMLLDQTELNVRQEIKRIRTYHKKISECLSNINAFCR